MRITSKGQVTIPIVIRERLGLHPNTEVEFEIVQGKTKPPEPKPEPKKPEPKPEPKKPEVGNKNINP